MRIVKKMTDNKFINLYEIQDPSKHVKGFQFAERLGKDSVAFICHDGFGGFLLKVFDFSGILTFVPHQRIRISSRLRPNPIKR